MIRALTGVAGRREPARANTLGMAVIDAPPPDALFASALNTLRTGKSTVVPLYDIERPGDVEIIGWHVDANGDVKGSPMCKYAMCPPGYQAFCQNCEHCSDSWALCRLNTYVSPNGLPYSPAGDVVAVAFWSEAVAHAAASWYQHSNANSNDATDAATNPLAVQPWIDRANAWFWGVRPFQLGKGFWDLVGGGSEANQLPWNEVPWGAISNDGWAWLSEHAAAPTSSPGWIDWKAVKQHADSLTFVDPLPNASSPDVDWMMAVPFVKGFSEAPASWMASTWARVPWATLPWTQVPWRRIPWAAIDWNAVQTTEDLKRMLTSFAALGKVVEGFPIPGQTCEAGQGLGVFDQSGNCVMANAYPGDDCVASDGRAGYFNEYMACVVPETPATPAAPGGGFGYTVTRPGGSGSTKVPPGGTQGTKPGTKKGTQGFGAELGMLPTALKAILVVGGATGSWIVYRLVTKQAVVPERLSSAFKKPGTPRSA